MAWHDSGRASSDLPVDTLDILYAEASDGSAFAQ